MNRRDEILTILAEECAEVIVECSKIQRFDNDGTALSKELGDLMALIDIAEKEGLVIGSVVEEQVPKKMEKLTKWSSLFKDNLL